jgi:hypothetical protein
LGENKDKDMPNNMILSFAEWIQDYCEHLNKEIKLKNQKVDSKYTRHHIQQWAESSLSFMADSTRLPCPSCKEPIPLHLDNKIITDLIVYLLKDEEQPRWKDINFIQDKMRESAVTHLIECKGHNKDCPISVKGLVALSELL